MSQPQDVALSNKEGKQGNASKDQDQHSIESQSQKAMDFTEKSVRLGFIRKVYSILFLQLLFTASIISLLLYHEPTRQFFDTHPEYFWISLATVIVTYIVMACCGNIRRHVPLNYLFLAIFTLAESFVLGVTAATFDAEVVLIAVGLTVGVAVFVTIFAFQTKIDFGFLVGTLYVALVIFLIVGITAAIFPNKGLVVLYAGIGVFLFSLFLIFDTQRMVGGNHSAGISPEEYIFAALSLYLDIVQIFVYFLLLLKCCCKCVA